MGDDDVEIAGPGAENAALGSDDAHVDAAATVRRSKRESAVKSEPGKLPSSAQEESATAQHQRRSQRSVKSTYATATVQQKDTLQRDSVGKKAPLAAVPAVEKEAEPARRTRSTRGAMASPPASPVKADVAHAPSSVKATTGPVAALAAEAAHAAEPATPPRNRRPTRRQAEADAGAAPSPRDRTHLILGAFSASDATSLCEVLWLHIKENSYKADVLLKDRSPGKIDWQRVSERLQGSYDVGLTARQCQRLWKFISYGKDIGNEGEETELLADSEPEEIELTAEQINARGNASSNKENGDATITASDGDAQPTATVAEIAIPATATTEAVAETVAPVLADVPQDIPRSDMPRETLRTNGIQLFPVYTQPSGVPDEWKKPFGVKQMMPLAFVAEKFLKRKTVADGVPADAATAAAIAVLSGEKTQPKAKRKRKSDVGTGEDGVADEKKPRKKKAPVVKAAPVGPSTAVVSDGSAITPAPAPGAATGKSPGNRFSYVPSSTPPPLPTAARSSLQFFLQLYKENPNIVRANGVLETPPTTTLDDPVQLEAAFARAPLQVRTVCEQMAVDDQRRFDREQLRRRLWEKAMASLSNSPAPSPGPSAPSTPAAAPAPVSVPVVVAPAVSSSNAVTSSQISSSPSAS